MGWKKKGQKLCTCGEKDDKLFLILRGKVAIGVPRRETQITENPIVANKKTQKVNKQNIFITSSAVMKSKRSSVHSH